jgi:hypothetical protein|nr:MAG TPA_asm: Fip1 motif [Caudoviricetes sp.]
MGPQINILDEIIVDNFAGGVRGANLTDFCNYGSGGMG